MAIQLTRRRFTVDEYHRMADAGVLSDDERVELIEGEIIDMTPIGVRHARCVDQLNLLLTGSLSKRARVRVQSPVRLNQLNEPQPDVTLLRMRDYSQDHAHPGPHDILLLIEVSDSTLDYDRTEKLPLYARSGIPEYWLVNLKDGIVEGYRKPVGDTYSARVDVRPTDELPIPGFPGASIPVSEILK